jgi:acyl-CoA thioesterase FadM
MYFSNHFRIQGTTRELWMNKCVNNADKHLSNGLILITKSAHCDYIRDFYLHDEVVCRMSIGRLRKTSFELKFEFRHGESGETHALGYQEIVFADSKHKICKMPDDFYLAARNYQPK